MKNGKVAFKKLIELINMCTIFIPMDRELLDGDCP